MDQRSCFILDEVEPTQLPCAKYIKSLFPHNHGTHSFQIPKASSEAITFFLSLQVCLCLPHDIPPRSRSSPIRRETFNMEQPSYLCLVEEGVACPPRHTEEETNWQSQKICCPNSPYPSSCANTNGFCWERASYCAHSHSCLSSGVSHGVWASRAHNNSKNESNGSVLTVSAPNEQSILA